jgi:hypothetical protein
MQYVQFLPVIYGHSCHENSGSQEKALRSGRNWTLVNEWKLVTVRGISVGVLFTAPTNKPVLSSSYNPKHVSLLLL